MKKHYDILIIGGGIAGLSCAYQLTKTGYRCRLLEASDRVGGRVRTDEVDGFLLDRGFQVFLTAYPEAKAILDYDRLDLRQFNPGSIVRYRKKFHRLSDPWRQPQHALATAVSPIATLKDKLRIASFRREMLQTTLDVIGSKPEKTTKALLLEKRFSERVIKSFFTPFFGGIFLESALETSSRKCEFVFQMFSQGHATLPAKGMEEIPKQLASKLSAGMITTNTEVSSVVPSEQGQQVHLASGETLSAEAVVIATEATAASRLLSNEILPDINKASHCVSNLYFAAKNPPVSEPTLVLNGEGPNDGPINNLCVSSSVSPHYAPEGKTLISVTVLESKLDESRLVETVKKQLTNWYGKKVAEWQHLKTYQIDYALPAQSPPALDPIIKPTKVCEGIYLAGDYLEIASINGAFASGRRSAEEIQKHFKKI